MLGHWHLNCVMGGKAVWQYETNAPNVWMDIPVQYAPLYEKSFLDGRSSFKYYVPLKINKYDAREHHYSIDLQKFLQTNCTKDKTCSLRRLKMTHAGSEAVWQCETSVPNMWMDIPAQYAQLYEEAFLQARTSFKYSVPCARSRNQLYCVDLEQFLLTNSAKAKTSSLRRLTRTQEAQ